MSQFFNKIVTVFEKLLGLIFRLNIAKENDICFRQSLIFEYKPFILSNYGSTEHTFDLLVHHRNSDDSPHLG